MKPISPNNPNQTENQGGRPEKYNPEELLKKSKEYFKYCEVTKIINGQGKEISKPKTVSGLCVWLKVSKDYISEKIKDDRFSEIIKEIKHEVENDIEEGAMIGKYNPTISALNLSSNFNWKTKTESEVTGKDGKDLFDTLKSEQLKNIAKEMNNLANEL